MEAVAVVAAAQSSVGFVEVVAVGGWRAVVAEAEIGGVEVGSVGYLSAVEGGMSAAQHGWQSLLPVRRLVPEQAGKVVLKQVQPSQAGTLMGQCMAAVVEAVVSSWAAPHQGLRAATRPFLSGYRHCSCDRLDRQCGKLLADC